MITVIGRTLPFAVAIAISPLPVIVAVLILVSDQARAKSVGYLLGRICAFAAVVAVVALIVGSSSTHHATRDHPSTAASIARVCVGSGLVALAIERWYRRNGADTGPNKLWQRVDRVTPARAFGLGVALVFVDVGTLILGIMAGLEIGQAQLSAVSALGAGAVFVVIALISCIAPTVAYLIAGPRLDRSLASTKTWLVANDRTVMMILFLVLGTVLVGHGVDALAR